MLLINMSQLRIGCKKTIFWCQESHHMMLLPTFTTATCVVYVGDNIKLISPTLEPVSTLVCWSFICYTPHGEKNEDCTLCYTHESNYQMHLIIFLLLDLSQPSLAKFWGLHCSKKLSKSWSDCRYYSVMKITKSHMQVSNVCELVCVVVQMRRRVRKCATM